MPRFIALTTILALAAGCTTAPARETVRPQLAPPGERAVGIMLYGKGSESGYCKYVERHYRYKRVFEAPC